MFDLFQRIHTPGPDTAADLHFTRAAQFELFQLALDKVGRREKEGDLASVVLAVSFRIQRLDPSGSGSSP